LQRSAHPLYVHFGSCRSNESSAILLFNIIAVNIVVIDIVIVYKTYKQPTNTLYFMTYFYL